MAPNGLLRARAKLSLKNQSFLHLIFIDGLYDLFGAAMTALFLEIQK